MSNPLRWFDAHWRTRICFVLVGAIFVLSQFIVARAPPARDDMAFARDSGSVQTDRGSVGSFD